MLFLGQKSLAQVFCLPPDQPIFPEVPLRAGLSVSFVVNFDVVGMSAKNIRINTKDSIDHPNDLVKIYSPSIMDYLNRLCFVRETNNFSLIIDFVTKPHASINRGYVEKLAEDRIRITGRTPHIELNTAVRSPGFPDCPCKDN